MASSVTTRVSNENHFTANYSGTHSQNNAKGEFIAQDSVRQYIASTINFGRESPLSILPVATDAPFNSSKNQHNTLYLPSTPVGILHDIELWVDRQDERCIFWLNGRAGTGKSTIARTIARRYYDEGRLGASLFFSRGGGDVSHAGKFFTSIASQLAEQSDILRDHIWKAISTRRDIGSKCFRHQLTHLILEPLSALKAKSTRSRVRSHWARRLLQPLSKLKAKSNQLPLLVMVDALDECDDDDDIRVILLCLAELKGQDSTLIRVFITSRPETVIRLGFGEMPGAIYQDLALHNVCQSVINEVISVFFRDKFTRMRNNTFQYLPDDWPGERIISLLVQRSEGLFIFAATVCRFIQDHEERTTQELLPIVLRRDSLAPHYESGENIPSTSPSLQRDEMYTTVLQHSFKKVNEDRYKIAELFRKVIGSIAVI